MGTPAFTLLDWSVFGGYFAVVALTSFWFSRVKNRTSRDYFVGGGSVPMLAAAVSLLATTQSAATFLGGPEFAYRKDWSFIGFYGSAFLAIWFVATVLVPRFYAIRAVTVYELLEIRYGARAKREAGVMFLVGRVLASGARLYIGALAVSMILFGDIVPWHILVAVMLLLAGALAYTYTGGIRSVIYGDVVQALTYVGAGAAVLWYLVASLNADWPAVLAVLEQGDKLNVIDTGNGNFSLASLLTGWLLLNVAAYGLDQDLTQRILSCKNGRAGARALYVNIALTVPVVLLFLAIGTMLYLFYGYPELFTHVGGAVQGEFSGEKITVFMSYILHEMPPGLRALVTVGAIAAALSSTNSVLAAMASVAVEDLYRPWRTARGAADERHFIKAARAAVLGFALLLALTAMLSYYWQRLAGWPLVSFALGVMAFAYAGLLGVYFSALFTKRGNSKCVGWAMAAGFGGVLLSQPYALGAWTGWQIGPAWPLVFGALLAFAVMQSGSAKAGEATHG